MTDWYRMGQGPEFKRGFRDLLLEAVDEGLSSLGEEPKQVVYSYLEDFFQIEREDIPHQIDEFADAVEEIFGCGAKLVEIEIMKRLYGKIEGESFQYSPIDGDLQFAEYIRAMKLSYNKLYPCKHGEEE